MCPRGEHIFLLFLSSVHCFFAYIYDMPNETFTPHNIRNRPISQRGLPVQQIGFIALWCAFSLTNCPLFSGAPTYSAAPASASESFDGLISSRLEGSPTCLVHEVPHPNTSLEEHARPLFASCPVHRGTISSKTLGCPPNAGSDVLE